MSLGLLGGAPLAGVNAGVSAAGSAGSFFSSFSAANPWIAGANLVMGALGGTSIKKSGANAYTLSGGASYTPDNKQAFNKPLIDLSTPFGVVIASGLVVGGIWAYKKYYKG